MTRILQPELLDELPVDDPRARRSRRDLRRVNLFMGNPGILARSLGGMKFRGSPVRLLELGAGDGTLLLKVARRLRWNPPVEAELLDRQALITPETRAAFGKLGWNCASLQADLYAWVRARKEIHADAALANLFLHHFPDSFLKELFSYLAGSVDVFVAVEPLRSPWCALAGHFLGLLGCNDVTRHDALASIRAGFDGKQLTALWPGQDSDWRITEKRAGLFSHIFVAQRKTVSSAG